MVRFTVHPGSFLRNMRHKRVENVNKSYLITRDINFMETKRCINAYVFKKKRGSAIPRRFSELKERGHREITWARYLHAKWLSCIFPWTTCYWNQELWSQSHVMLWAPKTLFPQAQQSINLLLSATTAAIRLVSLTSFEPLGLKMFGKSSLKNVGSESMVARKHITKHFLSGFRLFLVFRQTFLTGSDSRVEVFTWSSSRILIDAVW